MKTLFALIICLLSLYDTLWSQVPFLDSTYVWSVKWYYGFAGYNSTSRFTFSSVPTIINGLTYYEQLESAEEYGNNWGHTNMYYRTDDSSRVYINSYANEYLAYDYSLDVNDSVAIEPGFVYLVVDFIDSIILENGERRKRLALRCSFDDDPLHGWGYTYWIEGLGGDRGVNDSYLEFCAIDADAMYTLCISRNDSLLYKNPEFDSCWYLAVATIPVKEDPVVIFPNPTKDIIQLTGVPDQILVTIWNETGDLISRQSGTTIDLKNEPAGIYFISVSLPGNRNQFIRRVIKL